jgi:hypothetical protein
MRRAVAVLLSVLGVVAAGLVYAALVPMWVEPLGDCEPLGRAADGTEDDRCAQVVVEWRRVFAPRPFLELRDAADTVLHRELLPGTGDIDAVSAEYVFLTLAPTPTEPAPPDWLVEQSDPVDLGPSGTCVFRRTDGTRLACTARETRPVAHAASGDVLLELMGPHPHTVMATSVVDGHALWTARLDPGWDPAPQDDRARIQEALAISGGVWFHQAADGAVAIRAGERYVTVDLETGALTLATSPDATGICNEGSLLAESVGDEIRVSRDHPVAFHTIATPGPGAVARCAAGLRGTFIVWCSPGSETGPGGRADVDYPSATTRVASGCIEVVVDDDLAFVAPRSVPVGPATEIRNPDEQITQEVDRLLLDALGPDHVPDPDAPTGP